MTISLGSIVKSHRKKSGLTQNELARLASVGKTVIFDIEHDKETIQMDTILKVLKVLNIEIVLKSPIMGEEKLL